MITGQKVWTSNALEATHGMLVARSDWDVPKHRGITFFWFPMRQNGVEVRPIHQVTGGAEFNEVFLDGARVPDANRLGDVHEGWRTLQTALGFERLIMGAKAGGNTGDRRPDWTPEQQAQADRESPWTREVGGADYVELARSLGKGSDPVIRQEIARLYTYEQVNAWNAQRARAEAGPGAASPLASLGKLAMSRIVHSGVRVTSELLGAESVLDGPDHPIPAEVNRSAFAAYVSSIGGGTDQVQRNIIGERLLGLPKEPELDRSVRVPRRPQGTGHPPLQLRRAPCAQRSATGSAWISRSSRSATAAMWSLPSRTRVGSACSGPPGTPLNRWRSTSPGSTSRCGGSRTASTCSCRQTSPTPTCSLRRTWPSSTTCSTGIRYRHCRPTCRFAPARSASPRMPPSDCSTSRSRIRSDWWPARSARRRAR